MSEFDAPTSRREKARVAGVQSVVRALVLRHTTEVLPTQSSHYRPEEPEADVVQLQFLYDRLNAPDDAA